MALNHRERPSRAKRDKGYDVLDYAIVDDKGRRVTLTDITDDNWRAVADVVPRDGQRDFVPPSAARFLLLSTRERVWKSLAVCADDRVVGHVMWGWDNDDQRYWIGGLMVDAAEQGYGIARAAMRVLLRSLLERPDSAAIRLSYHPSNTAARRLYASLGFTELGLYEGDEIIAELNRDGTAL